ncbi:MAG: dihydrolipoyl dehydrogenase [Bacteroidales bacterium]|nr:dihydrolipoyl dehydrogenase [Bacteroidales bacterium]
MYDLAIIGGGPGGYVAAGKAGEAGLKVILFEKRELGGVCLNEGCIPTKTLLYSAKVLDYAHHAHRYGITVQGADPDYGAILKRKTKVVKKLVGGIKVQMRNAQVEVIGGEAVLEGRSSEAFTLSCNGESFEAKNILLCTGSEAAVPPIPGLREGLGATVLTNREILELPELPERLVVIGGGVIGMEFASFFNSLGTQVTVVEMLPKILGPMDEEISAMLQAQYAKKGVEFHLGCQVVAVEGNEVVYKDAEGQEQRATGDKILVSVGRRARLEGIGLEKLGVQLALNPAGRPYGVKVDAQMRTNVPGLYAAGDVTGFSMLAHTASREGEVAVNTILGKADEMHYNAIPGVVYTNPEVAGVGLTEAEAAAKGIGVEVKKLPMAYSGRFVAENERGEGLCKMILDAADGRILGVHMLGNPSSEIIQSACMAIEKGMKASDLEKVVFPHPTVSEILKECI